MLAGWKMWGHFKNSLVFYLVEYLGQRTIELMMSPELIVRGSKSLVLGLLYCSPTPNFFGLLACDVHIHADLPLGWSLAANSLKIFQRRLPREVDFTWYWGRSIGTNFLNFISFWKLMYHFIKTRVFTQCILNEDVPQMLMGGSNNKGLNNLFICDPFCNHGDNIETSHIITKGFVCSLADSHQIR